MTTDRAAAFPAIVEGYSYSPLAPALWREDARTQLQSRTLALDVASRGALASHHLRAAGRVVTTAAFCGPRAPFAFVFVLAGRITMRAPEGNAVTLGPMDTACRYGCGDEVTWTFSHDAEVIAMVGCEGGAATLGFADGVTAGRWKVNLEAEDAYVQGEGPRRYFRYRNLGVTQATGRRIHVHLVRATQSVAGGTGWHSHTMGQQFVVLRGWADVAVDAQPWVRMAPGDAMCIPPGLAHDVPAFSPDYLVLETCIPADYDTTEREPGA